ncbi:MAG: metal ABC transporter permease [Bacteroidales bacterium]|nr:MAG: metal ABC transporter permease [Bacteroidales bacterium]
MIKREIIFIDIALAQIAALGGAVSMVLSEMGIGHQYHSGEHEVRTFTAYLFCTLAAALFTLLKDKKIKIPLESIIGIAYAVAATGVVIILDKGAGADVHVHDMLTGSILWVTWNQVLRLSLVVTVIGGIHYVFRHKFLELTNQYLEGNSIMKNAKIWDFIFYFSFGIVIVEAVNVGGILTIFSFLIIPASISALFAVKWSSRIIIGFVIGIAVTIFGLYLSWIMDVPSSPTIILFLGLLLLISLLIRGLNIFKSR